MPAWCSFDTPGQGWDEAPLLWPTGHPDVAQPPCNLAGLDLGAWGELLPRSARA